MNPVLSKTEGMRLWNLGTFGNKLKTWNYATWLRDRPSCDIGLRYADPRGGGACFEAHIPADRVWARFNAWIKAGRYPAKITFCEEAPDHELIINGELQVDHTWSFFHSRLPFMMRRALREGGSHMYGLQTRHTLKSLMTPSSWADLEALVELYPDHIIELSVYRVLLGEIPGRNTIIWEVRRY